MIPSVGEHREDLVTGFGLPTGLITTLRWESTTATVSRPWMAPHEVRRTAPAR